MSEPVHYATGQPGLPPRWTSSAKSAVGASLSALSRVWFTIGRGVLNEIYYPNVDRACTRDLGLLVSDGRDFFSEEQTNTYSSISHLADGVPAYRVINTCAEGRYRTEKEILTDPERDVVLQHTRFIPLQNSLSDYHCYVLLSPHLGNRGNDNTGFLGEYKGIPMLFAERGTDALALACSAPWLKRSVGFVGVSDGWQDVYAHKQMTWSYSRAENGNIALTAEVDLQACDGEFILLVGFGRSPFEAAHRALASLLAGFDQAKERYLDGWRQWLRGLSLPTDRDHRGSHLAHVSAAVLRIHEAKRLPGALIASLSIPWGFTRGDDDLGGYHLVWPRDLVEAAGALLAIAARNDVRRILHYLHSTQEAQGYWPQNMWIDGTPYWHGIQMDETAFPILLVDMARREEALERKDMAGLWPMVKKAAAFIARNGPVTQEDRWENDPGYSPFTLAVEIAALLAAADLAEVHGEPALAAYLRETADYWNANIERWTYVKGTELAREIGVEGYYVRIASPNGPDASPPLQGLVPIKDHSPHQAPSSPIHIIGPDALALVRFGLRMPDDPRIADTMKVVDALLKVDTPQGPLWRRYLGDPYGEYEDGAPFDGGGKGRLWPLLTGERAHYELSLGRRSEAERLLNTLASCASEARMLPEQIWDSPDIPDKGLFFGKPTGAAMPLVWVHAEYLKLLRSLHDARIFDLPAQTVQRYLIAQTDSPFVLWRMNHKLSHMIQGKTLRVELPAPATIHWSADDWHSIGDSDTRDSGAGLWLADLPTDHLPPASTIRFTFYWRPSRHWEGKDFEVTVSESHT